MKVLIACEYSGTVRDAFIAKGHEAMSCDFLPTDRPGPHYQGDVRDILNDGWDLMIARPHGTYLTNSAEWAYKDPDFVRYPGVGYHQKLKPETLFGVERRQARKEAVEFFLLLWNCGIPRVCIENPVGHISQHLDSKFCHSVQPWQFGDDASKKTCLWLNGVPPLEIYYPACIPPRGWQRIMGASDMLECECCEEPFCPEHHDHYDDCPCIGPCEEEEGVVAFKLVAGITFATRQSPPPPMRWANQTDSGQNKLPPTADRWKIRSTTYPGIAEAMAEQWGNLPA